MTETFDPDEVRVISAAMLEFHRRCEEILNLLEGKRQLTLYEREHLQRLYTSLKRDLKDAAKHGTLSGRREPRSRAEQCFYDPSVRRAAIELRPPTNSHPIGSRWFFAVLEAQSEFTYYLSNMKGLPGAASPPA